MRTDDPLNVSCGNRDRCFFKVDKIKTVEEIWPLQLYSSGKWRVYYKRQNGTGTHSDIDLCQKHSGILLHLFETEALADVKEQEATDSWTRRNHSRL